MYSSGLNKLAVRNKRSDGKLSERYLLRECIFEEVFFLNMGT